MKVERFLKEYANYQKKYITKNQLMKEEYKEKAYTKIDSVLSMRERGMITVDETIRYILECLD